MSDVNLVFDSTHGLVQTVPGFGNVTVNLDMSGPSYTLGDLGAGWIGNGSLTIRDGVIITSSYGYLGNYFGSSGTATVAGTGSTWNVGSILYVGNQGSGTLNITDGGTVSSSYDGDIGNYSVGTVTVAGTGSTWNDNSGTIRVGNIGNDTSNISAGGCRHQRRQLHRRRSRLGGHSHDRWRKPIFGGILVCR